MNEKTDGTQMGGPVTNEQDGGAQIWLSQQDSRREEEEKQKLEIQKKRREAGDRFTRLGAAGVFYALFYAFCLYKNTAGVTFPFFAAGTFWFYCFCMKKSEVPLKKGAPFYMAAAVLLGISSCLTGDGTILLFNRMGVFLLAAGFLLHQYYEDMDWSFSCYLKALGRTAAGILCELITPYKDFAAYRETRQDRKEGRIKYVLAGAAAAVPLLAVVVSLLSGADRMFAYLFTDRIGRWLFRSSWPEELVGIVWTIFLGGGLGYGLMAFMDKRKLTVRDRRGGQGEPLAAVTAASMLAVVYLLFCGVQVIGLFFGRVALPEGYTYAGYAREGFFQLLFVCLLNLVLVLFCLGYFRKNKALQGILTVISLCTYVMIASSAYRMILYIRCYQLTFLRILVLWALALLTALMAGVLLRIYRPQFKLFHYSMAAVTVFYLVLSFSRPDYLAARYNVNAYYAYRQQESGGYGTQEEPQHEPDLAYLYYSLSSDAAPVLHELEQRREEDPQFCADPEDREQGFRRRYWNNRIEEADRQGIRTFNLSVYRAGQYAREHL